MVNKYALVKDGVTVNIVAWDGDEAKWSPPEGLTVVAYDPAIHVIPIPVEATNRQTIVEKATAALTTNATDITQNTNVKTQADALAATTGTRTGAQLSGDVRSLAQAVGILAVNDTNAKKELGALIRMVLERYEDTTGT